ncbi:MAG: DedA family protein [Proteobacteria bacterium]|nr:DedA family protein [Pseudomonadota bacterium]
MSEGAQARAGWNPIRGLYRWVMRFAEGRHAWRAMAVFAFAEASFFPVPPDLLLIPMALADRKRALLLAAWATFWSVTGGVFGYMLGSLLYESLGKWLIAVYGMGGDVESFSATYKHYAYFILAQGFTPIPYKLVAISAGFAHISLPLFILYSAITRGARFTLVAGALYLFGDPVRVFIEKWLELLLVVVLVLVIVGVVAVKYLFA